ncbi:MAG TPA: GlsB/YeaQ/YmgE family stress response membrane protein [bacterium]|nr:GlsB/YeaQ/YmgE family stress response membrane protein [bacterium]
MSGHDLVWYLIVGLLTGSISSYLVQGHGMGFVRDTAVGIVGALLGGWLAGELGIHIGGFFSALVMAIIGAVLFLIILRAWFFSRGRKVWVLRKK